MRSVALGDSIKLNNDKLRYTVSGLEDRAMQSFYVSQTYVYVAKQKNGDVTIYRCNKIGTNTAERKDTMII